MRASCTLMRKEKTKIPVHRAIAMDPAKGVMDLLQVFPRDLQGTPLLSLKDPEVELVFVVGAAKARQRFRLDKMLFGGNLDI